CVVRWVKFRRPTWVRAWLTCRVTPRTRQLVQRTNLAKPQVKPYKRVPLNRQVRWPNLRVHRDPQETARFQRISGKTLQPNRRRAALKSRLGTYRGPSRDPFYAVT